MVKGGLIHTVILYTLNWWYSPLYTVPQVSVMTDTQQTPTRPQGEARTQMRKCGLLLFHSGIFMQLCTVTSVCCFYSSPPCPPPPFSLQPIVAIANTLHLNMVFMLRGRQNEIVWIIGGASTYLCAKHVANKGDPGASSPGKFCFLTF